MSYRNPKQFVDTETAKYYSKLQETFTGITQNSINSLKARLAKQTKDLEETAKQNRKTIKEQEDYRSKQGQALNGATGSRKDIFNKSAIQGQFINSIDKTAGYVVNGSLTPEQRIEINNMNGLPQGITDDLTNLETLGGDYQEKLDKGNVMGGYSPYNDAEQMAAAGSIYGKGVSGVNGFSYDLTKPGGSQREYTHTNSFSGKTFTWTSGQIQEILADPEREIIVTIPDETVDMQNIANTFAFKKVNGKPTTELNDRYFETSKEEFRINEDGEKITYKRPNNELFIKDIEPESRSNVIALTRPAKLALYNYFQDQSVGLDKNGEPIKDKDGNVVEKNLYPLSYSFDNEKEEEDFMKELIFKYSEHVSKQHFINSGDRIISIEKVKEPEKDKPLTEGAIKRKIAKETAETVLNDMLESPKSYFKDRRINGKKVSDVRIVPSTVGEGGEKEGRTLEIGYESGTSTTGGERTIFTDEMTFDLDDPVRVRTLIDMLPEGDALKTALKKLTGKKNPLLNLNN